MIQNARRSLFRCTAAAAVLLTTLTACEKNDASAQAKLNDVAQQAGQKLDQAASYVGQQVDTARASAQQSLDAASKPSITFDSSILASGAQANLQSAASMAQGALGRAAGLTGAGLQTAGRRLQEWSSQSAASSTSASDASDAQKQMDK
ncbi:MULTISPECIES: hypothetical protein [Paraburkholderia]|uniref:hypothetical protein n=1 Tax=Paraburkholderia TaxID=1822464 RepID=UPI002251BCDC|nr:MULTISPECIES: hypothetical protein [Paraburkholderia]MCX4164372.1 hypothetical protein [Paraburkholderia megapolitana]MDN7159865.1 hypothetical protein [Paraburkholderia sp. CHISQ3]MDQ6496912.1 hypothetical protein [Paraburkholderia megapolitana]